MTDHLIANPAPFWRVEASGIESVWLPYTPVRNYVLREFVGREYGIRVGPRLSRLWRARPAGRDARAGHPRVSALWLFGRVGNRA
ncbi:hypothetical protein HAL_20090 [Haladaptatus sp. T7]|nr:hypothetical protein HAL_20090 [Haladaptatus sp. T7]